jgi:hypothetical protein
MIFLLWDVGHRHDLSSMGYWEHTWTLKRHIELSMVVIYGKVRSESALRL